MYWRTLLRPSWCLTKNDGEWGQQYDSSCHGNDAVQRMCLDLQRTFYSEWYTEQAAAVLLMIKRPCKSVMMVYSRVPPPMAPT